MPHRKKTPKEEHSYLDLEVIDYAVRISASINHNIRSGHFCTEKTRVYEFSTHLEIQAKQTYPEYDAGIPYEFSIYGASSSTTEFSMTLADCHLRHDDGSKTYRKVRGRQEPVYDIPKGIGHLEKIRGEKAWYGWLWVSESSTDQMLSLLPHVRPLYIDIHSLKSGRNYWIVNFTLQTSDPGSE